jgi:hypothetical protein
MRSAVCKWAMRMRTRTGLHMRMIFFSVNFLKEYKGSDRLRMRTYGNQIGQIHIPVAQGVGYTISPEFGVNAFSGKRDVAIVQLPKRRFNDLWRIPRETLSLPISCAVRRPL